MSSELNILRQTRNNWEQCPLFCPPRAAYPDPSFPVISWHLQGYKTQIQLLGILTGPHFGTDVVMFPFMMGSSQTQVKLISSLPWTLPFFYFS